MASSEPWEAQSSVILQPRCLTVVAHSGELGELWTLSPSTGDAPTESSPVVE